MLLEQAYEQLMSRQVYLFVCVQKIIDNFKSIKQFKNYK